MGVPSIDGGRPVGLQSVAPAVPLPGRRPACVSYASASTSTSKKVRRALRVPSARLYLSKAVALAWNSPASGFGAPVGLGPVPDPFTNKRPFTNALKTPIGELAVAPSIGLTRLCSQTPG